MRASTRSWASRVERVKSWGLTGHAKQQTTLAECSSWSLTIPRWSSLTLKEGKWPETAGRDSAIRFFFCSSNSQTDYIQPYQTHVSYCPRLHSIGNERSNRLVIGHFCFGLHLFGPRPLPYSQMRESHACHDTRPFHSYNEEHSFRNGRLRKQVNKYSQPRIAIEYKIAHYLAVSWLLSTTTTSSFRSRQELETGNSNT